MLLTHLCVLVWGFTAILGRVIELQALPLVAWRMLLTAICLFFMARAWRTLGKLSMRDFFAISSAGILIALHWLAFYASVKLANASVGVLCIAFAPVFSALLAPWLSTEVFSWRNFALSLSVIPGMLLVIGGVDAHFYLGIAVGVLSAFFVAAFGLVNKKLVARFEILNLSFIEISIGALLMWLILLLYQPEAINLPSAHDWPYLLVFALICTALPFALAGAALKHISAFSAQFAVNLEPVYGIVFAACLLGEAKQLTAQFYLGAMVILIAVFAQGAISVMQLRATVKKAAIHVETRML
jgi:drug/metabolite transporter (DMT)-like permease